MDAVQVSGAQPIRKDVRLRLKIARHPRTILRCFGFVSERAHGN